MEPHPDFESLDASSVSALFEEARPRLLGLAYRMLGSYSEAEDVVQETYLKWHGTNADLRNPAAWLNTVCSRLCLDHLKSAQAKRLDYVGPWLPEPVYGDRAVALGDDVERDANISMAFMLLLDRLTPKERVAYVSRELFGQEYAELAEILGESEANCRKLVSRAKRNASRDRERAVMPTETKQRFLNAFLTAVRGGDAAEFEHMLSADACLIADGGGKVAAIREPVEGAVRVLDFTTGLLARFWKDATLESTIVNGDPGLVVRGDEGIIAIAAFDFEQGEHVGAIHIMRNPDKMGACGQGS